MAKFNKAQFYTAGAGKDGGITVTLRDGYTFAKHGIVWGIYKSHDSHPKNLWWIIDLGSGLSIPCGFMTAFKSRDEALAMFDDEVFAKVRKAFSMAKYKEKAKEFTAAILEAGSVKEQEEHVMETNVQEASAKQQPVGVTEHNIWFAEKVDGACEYHGKRKKHQGMFWLPNTQENRERFAVTA